MCGLFVDSRLLTPQKTRRVPSIRLGFLFVCLISPFRERNTNREVLPKYIQIALVNKGGKVLFGSNMVLANLKLQPLTGTTLKLDEYYKKPQIE